MCVELRHDEEAVGVVGMGKEGGSQRAKGGRRVVVARGLGLYPRRSVLAPNWAFLYDARISILIRSNLYSTGYLTYTALRIG